MLVIETPENSNIAQFATKQTTLMGYVTWPLARRSLVRSMKVAALSLNESKPANLSGCLPKTELRRGGKMERAAKERWKFVLNVEGLYIISSAEQERE